MQSEEHNLAILRTTETVGGAMPLGKRDGGVYAIVLVAVENQCRSRATRRAYAMALDAFVRWHAVSMPDALLSLRVVRSYWSYLADLVEMRTIATATANLRVAALRKAAVVAGEMGYLDAAEAAAIGRIKGFPKRGKRQGMWLTLEATQQMLLAPKRDTLKGKRDAALLAVLFGCGLRRSEVVRLNVNSIGMREARWVLPDIVGKGDKARTVPVPTWVKAALDVWMAAARIEDGPIFRAMRKGGSVEARAMSGQAILDVVEKYASGVTSERFRPHDARRTCAKLCRAAGGRLEAIQSLLGHSSIMTTSVYLGNDEDLAHAVNDAVPLNL